MRQKVKKMTTAILTNIKLSLQKFKMEGLLKVSTFKKKTESTLYKVPSQCPECSKKLFHM